MNAPDVDRILRHVPHLRRHARLLTGSQGLGDEYVRLCLEVIANEPERLAGPDLRVQLFRAFHSAWSAVHNGFERAKLLRTEEYGERLSYGLAALTPPQRCALLLIVIDNFQPEEVSEILGFPVDRVKRLLNEARSELHAKVSVPVLIIEDEPLIVLEISRIIEEMGHSIIGVEHRQAAAVITAETLRPGLVLADIQLIDDESGIVAARQILEKSKVPVVFVTGFPERLLTGSGTEPAFVVSKPFHPEALKVTIAQALSTYAQPELAAAHQQQLLEKLKAITAKQVAVGQ